MISKFLGHAQLAVCSAVVVLRVGLGYFAASFSTEFSSNLGYSHAIRSISDQAERAINSSQGQRISDFLEVLKKRPLRGYETPYNELRTEKECAQLKDVIFR